MVHLVGKARCQKQSVHGVARTKRKYVHISHGLAFCFCLFLNLGLLARCIMSRVDWRHSAFLHHEYYLIDATGASNTITAAQKVLLLSKQKQDRDEVLDQSA
jgi:hypothetical protein